MAVGKNKGLAKSGKKGAKKKIVDPFTRKEWYDIGVPNYFGKRQIGKTLVNRTQGTKIASEGLKGRVFEVSLADLQNDTDAERSYRKFRLIAEDVQGMNVLTNFHGMDLTTDKLRSMVKKWQSLIEANVDVKTTDGYLLRVFCIGFTNKDQMSSRKTCYAQHTQIKAIRKKMVDTITQDVVKSDLKEVVCKLLPDSIAKDIEKKCQGIYPLHDVYIRKVKVLKKPRFDINKLLELHSDAAGTTVVDESGVQVERPEGYEPPVQEIRKRSRISTDKLNWAVHICSENNFPTAAGLASSSAGYACLVFALSKIYDVEGNVSSIARQGSGSACRSMFGGFVQWQAGVESDGSDSMAIQLAPKTHWPEMRALILVNDQKKVIGSTKGMQRTAETSQLFQYRIQKCVKEHVTQMIRAIKDKNFDSFAEVTMRESNQLHAVCLDTYPPAIYMNNTSHAISSFIHQYNSAANGLKVAYTFDAGPNACLFVLEKDVPSLLAAILKVFPFSGSYANYLRGMPIEVPDQVGTMSKSKPNLSS
ncbi:hypothetical protein V9T40_001720 [Parthenolecanium corni]|uniref:Small ribosomal subunit protein eS1 n=1 Tax=Parthenolecanium corni TaxID=536013 RepID=A0AAN9TF05_9HEMI